MQTLHEDPRELALRVQHDCHSHTHAIHVAFARLYRRAVPTPHVAAHYTSRLPLVRAWVAARIERENGLQDGQHEDERGQGEGGQDKEDTAEPEPEPPVEAAPSTTRERGAQKDKHRNKEPPKSALGKRKASSTAKNTITAPKTTATTTASKTTTSAVQHAAPATRATRSKHRRTRTEVERLLISRGVDPSPPLAPTSSTFSASASASAPAPRATTSPPLPPPAEPPKPRTEPKKPRTVPANTKTKRTPKTSSKVPTAVAEEQYEFLPHTPFTTEVIVNRYPLLDGSGGGGGRRKRGNEAGGAKLDMARLGMMCMKASATAGVGQKKGMVRVGRENGVGGGAGELVFLRRNKERVKRRLAAEARR